MSANPTSLLPLLKQFFGFDSFRTLQEEIIRDAIAAYAPKISRPLPKGIGAYRSGRSDVSERAEELLREAARERR